ncbi:MAG TPA: hypothetical protein DC009_07260 [Porphyromonadaceae bacterium]|nr:hypothetical protein [Porphyromonadaceae bacterium]
MKKFFLLPMLAAGLLTASAEQVTVTFEGTSGTAFTPPEGWSIQGTVPSGYFTYGNDGSLRANTTEGTTPILVTPPVMGEVTFVYSVDEEEDPWGGEDWAPRPGAKATGTTLTGYYDGGSLEAWDYIKVGDTYTKGNSLGSQYSTSYASRTLTVDPGHCIGFEMDYANLKSVTYEPYDPSQDTAERRSMSLSNVKYVSTPLYANEEGNVPFGVTFSVTNTGNVDLTPGSENYSVTLYTTTHGDLLRIPLAEALAVGETKTMTINSEFPISVIAEKTSPSSNGNYYVGCRLRENLKNTYQTLAWTDIYPYELKYQFQNGNVSTAVTALDFGFVTGPASKTITLMNKGSRVVNVTAMDVPAGFTVDAAAPFTVASARETEHSKELTISVKDDASGIINGTLSLTIEGADEPLTLDLSGVVASGDNFFENFEGEAMPAGWLIDDALRLVAPEAASWGEGNTHVLHNASSNYSLRAVTPRIAANEGEKVVFQAAPASTYGTYSRVAVYYSTNRLDWRLVKSIRSASGAEEGDEKFSSNKPSGGSDVYPLIYTIDMPAGEGYLAFDICYARIDNVYGCHAAAVEHDLMYTVSNVPASGIVNHAVNTSVTVKNINTTAEAAGSYTMELLVNGEVAKTATETPELASATAVPFEMSFTPHEAGTYTVRYRLTIGENYTLETADYTVEVAAESANSDVTVGIGTLTDTTSSANTTPVCSYNNKTHSELVFTQDYLAQYGITPGAKLTGIAFSGYFDTGKSFTGTYKVYLAPTELSAIAPAGVVELTDDMLVYSNTSYTEPKAGTKGTAAPVLKVTFDTPYTYNGGNMLLGIVGEFSAWSSSCQFVGDASEEMAARAILRKSDNNIENASWIQAKMFAQTIFTIEQTPASVAGVVYGDTDKTVTVADAEIVLTSGEVMYKGTSDENGAFSINVFQSDKVYDVNVTATGYNDYTSENAVSFANGDVNIEIILTADQSGVDGIAAEGCNVRIAGDMITVEGATDVRLAIYSVNGMLCGSAAQNTISTADLAAGIYVLRVEAAEGTNTVRFIKK